MSQNSTVSRIRSNLARVIRGKQETLDLVLCALFAEGHVLIEDVPGVGKTTLCKALARSVDARFHRVQFTPDLLPTDILGGMVYSPREGTFTFRPGPVFCNILLADEINRGSPRTQSALLECMNEMQVSVEGTAHALHAPFMVVATQNPIEYHGTYPLPEAQLDRFALRLAMGYPTRKQEVDLVKDQRTRHPLQDIEPVAGIEEILDVRSRVRETVVEDSVLAYMTGIVRATREDSRLRLGASPRATATLYRCAQSLACIGGRDFVTPDDVKALVPPVLAHRILPGNQAAHAGLSREKILSEILQSIRVPV